MEFLQQLLGLNWINMLRDTLNSAAPIILAAMAGIISERSGVTNIALEGIMLTAAFVAFATGVIATPYFPAPGPLDSNYTPALIGLLCGALAGGLIAFLHAVLSIRYRTDQVISGTVINILAAGITSYLYRQLDTMKVLDTNKSVSTLPVINVPGLQDLPVIGEILFQQQPIVYATLIGVFVLQFLIYRTRWGLRTRAIGEYPRAADTAGVNVNRMRYRNVVISGLVAGIGGAWLVVEAVGTFSPNMTVGRGFYGLAAMIFGNWNPVGAFLASLLFTIPASVGVKLQLLDVKIPYQFVGMLPYVLSILVLAIFMKRNRPPAAIGKPYP